MSTDKEKEGLYKELTYKIIGALYEVHNELGPVHKENIYHKAVALELKLRALGYAVPIITKAMFDQIFYYIKGTKYNLVLLANFGTASLTIKRRIYT